MRFIGFLQTHEFVVADQFGNGIGILQRLPRDDSPYVFVNSPSITYPLSHSNLMEIAAKLDSLNTDLSK